MVCLLFLILNQSARSAGVSLGLPMRVYWIQVALSPSGTDSMQCHSLAESVTVGSDGESTHAKKVTSSAIALRARHPVMNLFISISC